MNLQERINLLIKAMGKGIIGREEVIKLSLLAALSGQSIFLLGPPGVAKSLIARRLKLAFKGMQKDDKTFENIKVFEYLMGKFSTPDEVFGPLDINKLTNDKGTKYERIIDKYLPGANIVFLDEIWKASPAIQNSLLTVINEKIFLNGDTIIKVPLRGLIAASNELPAKDQGLEALWDRFIIREFVNYLEKQEDFDCMVTGIDLSEDEIEVPKDIQFTENEYFTMQKEIDKIEIPVYILKMTHILRSKINKEYNERLTEEYKTSEQIIVSDRRWRKIFRLLRTSAYCNNRKEVNSLDFFLLENCINNTMKYSEVQFVRTTIQDLVRDMGQVELNELSEYEKVHKEIDKHVFATRTGKSIIINKLHESKFKLEKELKEKERQAEEEKRLQEVEKNRKEEIKKEQDRLEELKKSGIMVSEKLGLEFVLIPPGEFLMGASQDYNNVGDNEKPQHLVRITRPFYMAKTQVTQEQWKLIMGNNPSFFNGNNLPVESVSWYNVQEFIKKINSSINSKRYRLPTEAEWEYAARAGTTTQYYWSDKNAVKYCWFDGNSMNNVHSVGLKLPNNYGLYDMIGNVWEWCEDNYNPFYYKECLDQNIINDPVYITNNGNHILRGCSWNNNVYIYSVSNRIHYEPMNSTNRYGFRLVMNVES